MQRACLLCPFPDLILRCHVVGLPADKAFLNSPPVEGSALSCVAEKFRNSLKTLLVRGNFPKRLGSQLSHGPWFSLHSISRHGRGNRENDTRNDSRVLYRVTSFNRFTY